METYANVSSIPISQLGSMIRVQLRYNFRLYPSAGQRMALARAFGCARVVYNDALRARGDRSQRRHALPEDR